MLREEQARTFSQRRGNSLACSPESQGQKLALTVLYVPSSLDSRGRCRGRPYGRQYVGRDIGWSLDGGRAQVRPGHPPRGAGNPKP